MLHRFIVTYDTNGVSAPQQEMTYDDADIKATLLRRIKTAFPNAVNIQITRKPEEQLSLTDKTTTRTRA